MVKSILIAILLIFTVLGICDQIYTIRMFFFRPNIKIANYMIIALKSKYSLKQLNYLHKKICWYGDEFATGIIAIIDDLDDKEILTCKKFISGKNIVLCDLQSLPYIGCLQGEL